MTRTRMKAEAWRGRAIGTICIWGLCCASLTPARARADDRSAGAARSTAHTGKAAPTGKEGSWLFVPVLASPLPANINVAQLSASFEAELRSAGMDVLANTD